MGADVIRLRALFEEAIQLALEDRSALLDARCNGDDKLRRRVEALIATAEENIDFLSAPTGVARIQRSDSRAPTVATASLSMQPGTRIGPYKLLQQIGEGGFGVVFLAEQEKPVVRRVALKIIKLGMDTRAVVARFEAERQALAMMDHPNIARVLDAGATDTGRPYFVMELVRGIPIADYCNQERLSSRKRCELFVPVCQAVQHAHTKGIIHRDLKPSNVLVTLHDGEPVPKVIDFGIAKATGAKLTEKTLFTEHRAMIGTPAYMSPEQAEMSGLDVDARSDIYSLGVLLYELLTGAPPFDAKELLRSGLAEMQRMIREIEPERPSTRISRLNAWPGHRGPPSRQDDSGQVGILSPGPPASSSVLEISRQRRTDPQSLARIIRGDLDWIVMKCLEKDRARRYETAHALALDMQRHLQNEPVLAGPPSQSYRLRKFIQRNRVMVTASAAVGLAILLGGIGTSVGMVQALQSDAESRRQTQLARDNETKARDEAVRAEREAETARLERDKAERIARFMADLLEGVKPSVALGRDTTMLREMLDAAAERIENGEMQDAPEAELRLRWTIGGAYQAIAADGGLERAERILLPTLALAERSSGPESEQMAGSLSRVADCLDALGRAAEALPKCEAALAIRRNLFRGDHAEVAESLNDVAYCLVSLGRYAEALPNCGAALELRQRLFAADHPDVASSLDLIANCLSSLSRHNEALPQYQTALEMRQRLFQGDHPDVAGSLHNLAVCLQALGRSAEALPRFKAALEMNQRVYPHDHPEVATSLSTFADCLRSLDRAGEALPKFEAALEMRQRLYRGGHPAVAQSLDDTATCLGSLGRWAEALPKYEAALELRRRLFDGDRAEVAGSLNNLALCLRALDRAAEALPKFQAAHEMNQRLYSGDHPELAATLGNVALCLQSLGRFAEALPGFEASLEMERRIRPGDHSNIATALDNLANCLVSLGLCAAARPQYEAALEMLQRMFQGDHVRVASALNSVALCLKSLGRPGEALPKFEAALQMRRRLFGVDHPQVAVSLHNLADCLQAEGRSAEALPRYAEALEMARRLYDQPHPLSALVLHHLADCLHQTGDLPQAERLASEAVEVYRAHPDWHPDEHRHAEQVLAEILVARGDTVEAAAGLRALVALQRAQRPQMDVLRSNGLSALASVLLKDAAPASAAEAESLLVESLSIREQAFGPNHVAVWVKYETMSKLGAALAMQGKFAEAEPLLLHGFDGLKDDPRVPSPTPTQDRKREALARIVNLYEARDAAAPEQGWAEMAATWRSRLGAETAASREGAAP